MKKLNLSLIISAFAILFMASNCDNDDEVLPTEEENPSAKLRLHIQTVVSSSGHSDEDGHDTDGHSDGDGHNDTDGHSDGNAHTHQKAAKINNGDDAVSNIALGKKYTTANGDTITISELKYFVSNVKLFI